MMYSNACIYLLVATICSLLISHTIQGNPHRPNILVWSRDISRTLHGTASLRWSLLTPDYDLQFISAFDQPTSRSCYPEPIESDNLIGVDILILSNWDGRVSCGITGNERLREVNANLSAGEIDLIEEFVRSGGRLLVIGMPIGRRDEDNLPELLARFGLTYRHATIAPFLEQVSPVTAELNGVTYQLSLNGMIDTIEGGEAISHYQEQTFATMRRYHQGNVAFLGASGILANEPAHAMTHPYTPIYPPQILVADNTLFWAHLVAHLANKSFPSSSDWQQRLWQLRLEALSIAFAGGSFVSGQPAPPNVADPTGVQGLRAGHARGVRCDVTSQCVPFDWEEGDDERLAMTQEAQDRGWAALERLRQLLEVPTPDWDAVAVTHDAAIQGLTEAYTMIAPIRARPVHDIATDDRIWGWAAGLAVLIGAPLVYLLRCSKRKKPAA